MEYVKYAFIEKQVKGQGVFRIVVHESKITISTKVFVSDRFSEKVMNAGLEGFDFIQVWDSNESISRKEQESQLTNLSEESYTFDEALNYSEQHKLGSWQVIAWAILIGVPFFIIPVGFNIQLICYKRLSKSLD